MPPCRRPAQSPGGRHIPHRAQSPGRIAFREADHRAGITDLARTGTLVIERLEGGASFAGHAGAGLRGQHPPGHLARQILDVVHGSSPAAKEQSSLPPAEELSPSELRVLRYLPTNLSRPEIAGELSVSVNTVNTRPQHLRQAPGP
jgi:hypothetical protein